MSEPIKVGDLVQVVRWAPCGCGLGIIYTVRGFCNDIADSGCAFCWTPMASDAVPVLAVKFDEDGRGVPISWVRRIPDFPELADERHDEEITA